MAGTARLLSGQRALVADAARLVVAAELLAGAVVLEPLRPGALARAVHAWIEAVRADHEALDERLPADLRDGRAALGPALDRLGSTADALAAGPDEDTATALAVELAELRDVLRELLDDEQAVLRACAVPAVSRPGR